MERSEQWLRNALSKKDPRVTISKQAIYNVKKAWNDDLKHCGRELVVERSCSQRRDVWRVNCIPVKTATRLFAIKSHKQEYNGFGLHAAQRFEEHYNLPLRLRRTVLKKRRPGVWYMKVKNGYVQTQGLAHFVNHACVEHCNVEFLPSGRFRTVKEVSNGEQLLACYDHDHDGVVDGIACKQCVHTK